MIFTIRDLPTEERPRERLQRLGESSLSTQELIALVLGTGIQLIPHFGSLENLSKCSLQELLKIKGIGLAKACQLIACFELGKRMQKNNTSQKVLHKINNPETVFHLLKNDLQEKKKEYFIVMSLDTRNHLISADTISIGTLNSSLVHPRETFDCAVHRNAAQIILVHNHPSGIPEPSEDDISITKRLVTAGKIMGIEVLDHIIIGKDEWFSMKEKRMM
jgi:DNA repair protein RadC